MSTESAVLVRLPGEDPAIRALMRDIRSADKRARKALPGERTDIIRVESLSAQLERLAATKFAERPEQAVAVPSTRFAGFGFVDAHNLQQQELERRQHIVDWISAGDVAVEIRLPFNEGSTDRTDSFGDLRAPEATWKAPEGTPPKKAAALRFREQIAATLVATDPPAHIEPSGVANSILTDTLREYVTMPGELLEAPVRYQDGSIANPFPLRSLGLRDTRQPFSRELRLAMLSIRHTEMDVEVDGCWLRNLDVSRPRRGAETDQLAYEQSRTQLAALTKREPVLIRLYQTGFEAAVVGFYRALVHQLLDSPASVAVVPMYFRRMATKADAEGIDALNPKSFFAEGRPWTT